MDYTIEYPEKNVAVINIQVSKEDWEKDMEQAKTVVPGDNTDQLRQYAISSVASQALGQAIQKEGLKLSTAPAIVADDADNGDVLITLTCNLLPEVKLGQYTGLNVKEEPVDVTEEELAAEITNRINAQKLWETLPADTPAKEGDRVMIDFIGEKDGVPFEGGSGQNFGLVLGSGQFIPGFEEQLIGTKAGETKDVNVTFPENYFEPSLAGAPVVFHVTVNAVQEEIKPELNDAFIEKMELDGVKTVEQMKEKVKAEMLAMKKQEADNKQLIEILEKISGHTEVDIPQQMIDTHVAQHIAEMENNLKQYGMTLDAYLNMIGMTMEAFREQIVPQAIMEIRHALILEAISAKEDIQAEQKEIQEEYELLARVYNMPAAQLQTLIPAGNVAQQITQKKTLDFLKEANTAK